MCDEFIEIAGVENDGGTAVARCTKAREQISRSSRIQPSCRVLGDDEQWRIGEFAS
jgi:hypothetical protein